MKYLVNFKDKDIQQNNVDFKQLESVKNSRLANLTIQASSKVSGDRMESGLLLKKSKSR